MLADKDSPLVISAVAWVLLEGKATKGPDRRAIRRGGPEPSIPQPCGKRILPSITLQPFCFGPKAFLGYWFFPFSYHPGQESPESQERACQSGIFLLAGANPLCPQGRLHPPDPGTSFQSLHPFFRLGDYSLKANRKGSGPETPEPMAVPGTLSTQAPRPSPLEHKPQLTAAVPPTAW